MECNCIAGKNLIWSDPNSDLLLAKGTLVKLRKRYWFTIVGVFVVIFLGFLQPVFNRTGSRIATSCIPLEGTATGGTLYLGRLDLPYAALHNHGVSIETFAGEPAESVVERLARVMVYSDNSIFGDGTQRRNADWLLETTIKGNSLFFLGNPAHSCVFAGSERGLGIPQAPHSLSCAYNLETNAIEVQWVNPSEDFQYDEISLNYRGSFQGGSIMKVPTANYTIQIPKNVNTLDLDIWVKGLRNKSIPSNIAYVHLTNDGFSQEELCVVPFSGGIAPNWQTWGGGGTRKLYWFDQGLRYDRVPLDVNVRSFSGSPFYQIIGARGGTFKSGTCRLFGGLTPGHTYRITIYMNTLEMEFCACTWSYSLHAVSVKSDLIPKMFQPQMGKPHYEPDFNKTMIANYGPGKTTQGFEFVSTDYTKHKKSIYDSSRRGLIRSGEDFVAPHITLPSGIDNIMIWTCFQCADLTGKVAHSGVRLDDVTVPESVLTPEQIIEIEHKLEQEYKEQLKDRETIRLRYEHYLK